MLRIKFSAGRQFPACVVFAKIIPIAALGVFTKRIRRSEWRFAVLGYNAKQGALTWFERYWHRLGRPRKAKQEKSSRLAWYSPRSSQSPRLVFSPSAYGGVSGALAWFERYWHRLGRPRKAETARRNPRVPLCRRAQKHHPYRKTRYRKNTPGKRHWLGGRQQRIFCYFLTSPA